MAGAALGSRFRLSLLASPRGGRAGTRLGRGIGSSLEFEEYRDYQPGDDVRRLDWSVYARTDRLVLRTHREEVSPRLDLFVDVSRSMGVPQEKGVATWRLAAALAAAAEAAGLQVVAWRVAQGAARLAPAGSSALAWAPLELDGGGGPPEGLRAISPLPPGGVRLLLTDLLFPGDPDAVLRSFAEGAQAAAVVQLAARSETAPELAGELRLRDVETTAAADLLVDGSVVAAYLSARARHLERWEESCRRHAVMRVELGAEAVAGEDATALLPLVARGLLSAAPSG
jgi:uncharacterized protein (DUF58 family)